MKRNNHIKKLISAMAEKIKREYKPEKIILFGSYAYGKPTRHSDVDLLIVKKTDDRPIDRRIRIRNIVEKENCQVAISLLVYTPKEIQTRLKMGDDFIGTVLKKGKVLYG